MGQAISVTRTEHTAETLREFAAKSGDGAQVRRLLAIALILEGRSRTEAAELSGMDRQTLSDWVPRYNAAGIAGLSSSRRSPGRPPFLNPAQMAELKALVIKGPDPETDRVVRWRCVDLQGEVAERFAVTVDERTIGKWLRKLDFTRLQPRPFHPRKNADAQETFKQSLAGLLKYYLLSSVADPIEIWFQDEARVGQKGTHAYVWALIGSRPPMVRDNRHDSAYLYGAICPARGVGAAVIMPAANAEGMNEHLKEISTQVASGAHAALICDGAGWHQLGGKLRVPDNITLVPLPPYAPELNPMENVWAYLRANKLCNLVWDSYEAIVQVCKQAWDFLITDPARIRSIGTREWACVSL